MVLGGALLAIPVLIARTQERGRICKRAFVPAALWLVFVGIALLNPSHYAGELGWQPSPDWIKWLPTTPSVARAEAAAIPWLAALLQGGVLLACPPGRRQTRLIWSVVALNGAFLAIVGAGFHFVGATRLLGLVDAPERYFFAAFFYKNHWAAYGALCGGTGLALALEAAPEALRGSPRARGRALLFGGSALLTLVTLPLPSSRSGLLLGVGLLAAAALVFLCLVLRHAIRARSVPWLPLTALAAIGAGIVGYGGVAYAKTGAEDFARTERQIKNARSLADVELRMMLSRDTWRMAKERPVFGWGPGSFELVFPVYQGDYLRDAQGRPTLRVNAAHNDWLQQLAETGVTGLLLFVIPIVLIGVKSWRSGGVAARCGLGVGCLLLVYALADFPFHNPAFLVLWTVLWCTAGRLTEPKSSPV